MRLWQKVRLRSKTVLLNGLNGTKKISYIKSIENVTIVKKDFGSKIKLNLVIKDFTKGLQLLKLNVDSLEKLLPKLYTEEELTRILK